MLSINLRYFYTKCNSQLRYDKESSLLMDTESPQRDPRKECLPLDTIEDSTLPIEFLNEASTDVIHALLINGSVSGCCLLCNKDIILPESAHLDFFEENKELWRVQAGFDIKWQKKDLSISYCVYGMVLIPATKGDKFVWEELYESLLSGERQFVCCVIHPI